MLHNGRTTLSGLCDLVRGLGGGAFDTVGDKSKGQRKRGRLTNHRETIDLEAVCGGKLAMSREVRRASRLIQRDDGS